MLTDHLGHARPVQARALERWSDGSVRWLLLDFQSRGDEDTSVDVDFAGRPTGAPEADHPSAATARSDGNRIRLSSGIVSLGVGPGDRGLFLDLTHGDRRLIDPGRTRLVVRGAGGVDAPLVVQSVTIEEPGPLRASVHLHGRLESLALDVICRIEVFAGLPVVRLRVTLHNPRSAEHPGGLWELGDPGSVLLEQVSLAIAPPADARAERVSCAIDRESPMTIVEQPFRLHQESSGRPNWESPVHRSRTGVASPRYRGYRMTSGGLTREAPSASPIVRVDTPAGSVCVTSRLFWEVFPKAYAVSDEGVLAVDLLPADRSEDHELQAGEQFSHELAMAFDDDPLALEWVRTPSTPMVDPAWWAQAGDVSHLSMSSDPGHPYEQLVRAAIDGHDTFQAKRDRIDEYGWQHYGDLYADHENGAAGDRPPIVSHYNNQYDGIAGLLVQFMRSRDPRWWELARDMAAHVRYIDIYATDGDKSAYNNGLFWHTYHYVDAGRASHRSYPKAPGVAGGGPSIEHNYSTGLMLHYLMTGDRDSRDAVLRLARWTIDMDDGGRTIFRYLSRGATGLASATGGVDYHGPGRGPANAIQTLLNAVRLTGDRAWLDKAEELIRRCVHPHDDLEARNLLDAERRWYYTVFLQALGRYLAFKTERGEEDATWRYARASVLHYARWMVLHEYPYLEKPEILEYPTETWAAQDMRKCDVLDLAAKYAETSDERERFIERARYFFEQSVSTLHRWPTRTWTRPVVLMLSYGYAHLWHEAHRDALPLLPSVGLSDFGQPSLFEPQKTIALRRAKWLVIGAAATALFVLAAGVYLAYGGVGL